MTESPLAIVNFGSVGMLAWALAAVLPILIHLWSRRNYSEVPWAAMDYLLSAIRKNARRLRIEQIVLLALRVLILMLLAVALADPMISARSGIGQTRLGRQGRHVVLVIDGSYSMDFGEDGGLARFERAQQLAVDLVARADADDGFSLVLMSEPTEVIVGQPLFDREAAIGAIEGLTIRHAGGDLTGTLGQLRDLVQTMRENESRLTATEIYFFTDLGRTTWQSVKSEACLRQARALADRAEMILVDVGQDGRANLAITDLRQEPAYATEGRSIDFTATIKNFGPRPFLEHPVELIIDGRPAAQKSVDVAPGEQTTVGFVQRFGAGEHAVEVRLGRDGLDVDNHRFRCVPSRDSLPVLCVSGTYGAARHVALALEPTATGTPRIRTRLVAPSAISESELRRYDCVFLCNVARFGREEAAALRGCLARGGGLVFFLGDAVEPDVYNRTLGDEAAPRLLPAELEAVSDEALRRFDPRDYDHPIVAPFRGFERAGLRTTPVWRYMRLIPYHDPEVRIALWFDNGDPAIVEQPILGGRSILVATSASDDSVDRSAWSALATWPSFPPLVQEMLALAVADRYANRNLHVGDEITSSIQGVVPNLSLTLVHNGERDRIPLSIHGEESRWSYSGTRRSGVYEAEYTPSTVLPQRFAVNVDTRESDLRRIGAEELPSSFRLEIVGARSEAEAARIGAESRPLFRMVLTGLLVVLLTETFLGSYFGRDRA